jgi:hypothetical protein
MEYKHFETSEPFEPITGKREISPPTFHLLPPPATTLLSQRPQQKTPNISTWMISIRNIPNSLRGELRHLPGNTHTNPSLTTLAPQKEPPATKRTRFSTTLLWLHETNRPPNVTLNPPTSPPTETAVTPSLDDYDLAFADEDVGNAPALYPP